MEIKPCRIDFKSGEKRITGIIWQEATYSNILIINQLEHAGKIGKIFTKKPGMDSKIIKRDDQSNLFLMD
jgi:hypothetical protein